MPSQVGPRTLLSVVGPFLIPYFTMLLFGGIPLIFMSVDAHSSSRISPCCLWAASHSSLCLLQARSSFRISLCCCSAVSHYSSWSLFSASFTAKAPLLSGTSHPYSKVRIICHSIRHKGKTRQIWIANRLISTIMKTRIKYTLQLYE